MRRPWRDKDLDSRTNIIVTKAKLQDLAIMGGDAFSQSESIEARPVQPDHSIYGRLLSRCGVPLAEPVIAAVRFSRFIAPVRISRRKQVQAMVKISSGAWLYPRLRSRSWRLAQDLARWRENLKLPALLRQAGRSRKCGRRKESAPAWREGYVQRLAGHLRVE